MSKFPPNKYQQEILDWVNYGSGNAIVNAKAGTGKTSTLELIAESYPRKMLFLAFNNHIAAEINAKPELQQFLTPKSKGGNGTLKVMTTNSLGNQTILEDIRKRQLPYRENGYLNNNKLFTILTKLIRNCCNTRKIKITEDIIWTMIGDLRTACDMVRSKYISSSEEDIQKVIDENHLCDFSDNETKIPILPWAKICEDALEISITMYNERGDYDFVEQLYIPVVNKLYPPAWVAYFSEFIAVDEAQDFSKLQLAFIKKLISMKPQYGIKKPTRFLFVGDRNQSIYGFCGADCHSMDNIKRQFNTEEFDLNICYRCSKKIIQVAQQDVPSIEASDNAIDGEVHIIDNEQIADLVEPQNMVIARKNKDLADIFLSIVLKGKPVYIKDKDLIEKTIKSINNLQCKDVSELKDRIDNLHDEFITKMKNPENSLNSSAINNGKMDIYDTIQLLLDFYIRKEKSSKESINNFTKYISGLFVTEPSDNAVIVSSIHQVKGLEADTVFIINYNLMPYVSAHKTAEDNAQEKNLRYIAVTRAKKKLYLCNGTESEEEKIYRNGK